MVNLKIYDKDELPVELAGRGAGTSGDPLMVKHYFAGPAQTPVTATATSDNGTATGALDAEPHYDLDVSIDGIAGGTIVQLQRRYNLGAYKEVERFTSDVQGYTVPVGRAGFQYRLAIPTGSFGSGTCIMTLGQG